MKTKLRKWQWKWNCSHAKGINGIGHHQPTNGQPEFEPIKIIYISWIHFFFPSVDTEVNAYRNYYLMESAMARFFLFPFFVCIIESAETPTIWAARVDNFSMPFNRNTRKYDCVACDFTVQSMRAANDIESNEMSSTMQIFFFFLIFRRRYFYGDVKFFRRNTHIYVAHLETRAERERKRSKFCNAVQLFCRFAITPIIWQ